MPVSYPLGPVRPVRKPPRPLGGVATGKRAIIGWAGSDVFRSVDAGRTWVRPALDGAPPRLVASVALLRSGVGAALFAPQLSFGTDDEGESWARLAPAGGLEPLSIEDSAIRGGWTRDLRDPLYLATKPLRWVPDTRRARGDRQGASADGPSLDLDEERGTLAGTRWLVWQRGRDDQGIGLGDLGDLGRHKTEPGGLASAPTLWEEDLTGSHGPRQLASFPDCAPHPAVGASPDGSILVVACGAANPAEQGPEGRYYPHALAFRSIDGGRTFNEEAQLHSSSFYLPALEVQPPCLVRVGPDGTTAILGASTAGERCFNCAVFGGPTGYYDIEDDKVDDSVVVHDVAFTSTGSIFLAGHGNLRTSILRYAKNNGDPWQDATGVPPGLDLLRVSATGEYAAVLAYRSASWVSGSEAAESPEGPQTQLLLISTDGGANWREQEQARGCHRTRSPSRCSGASDWR